MLSDDIDTKLISCLQAALINGFQMNSNFMTTADFNYLLSMIHWGAPGIRFNPVRIRLAHVQNPISY